MIERQQLILRSVDTLDVAGDIVYQKAFLTLSYIPSEMWHAS